MDTDVFENSWTQTFTQRRFNILEPDVAGICLADISHALSLKCRFGGHCSEFYSVAEHSCRVYDAAIAALPKMDHHDRWCFLFHDAAEAYIPDLLAPWKWAVHFMIVGYKDRPTLVNASNLEARILFAIATHFEIPPPLADDIIPFYDMQLLATEARDLMMGASWPGLPDPLPTRIEPWSPRKAEEEFYQRAYQIEAYRHATV